MNGETMTCDAMRDILGASGVAMSEGQTEAMRDYGRLLREWNERVNLISRKDVGMLWRSHILHALAVCAVVELPPAGMYIDVGTGGGLPGIPLAILVDSIAKKIRAVEEIAAELSLPNVRGYIGRVEDLAAKAELAGSADIVCARAVASLSALVDWAGPLFRAEGERRLIAWKGGDLHEEAAAARRGNGVADLRIHAIALAGEEYFLREEKQIVEVFFHA